MVPAIGSQKNKDNYYGCAEADYIDNYRQGRKVDGKKQSVMN